MTKYELPDLPYSHEHFEPFIPKEIMDLHHKTHHQTYINNLNKFLEQTEYPECYIGQLIHLINKDVSLDPKLKSALLFNAGGHYNHSLYWKCMENDKLTANPALLTQIEKDFGTFENLKEKFLAAALSVLGIGWQYLCYDPKESKLVLFSTFQQGTPLPDGLFPLLACDLWEHAWYLKFKADKKTFLTKWMDVINWDNVSIFFDLAVRNKMVDFLHDGNVDVFIETGTEKSSV